MSQIVRALEGDVSLEDLNEGVKPGHSAIFGSTGSSEYDGSNHGEMKKFRKAGLSSQEFTSSEHGVTGEFVNTSSDESPEIRRMRSP
ncbi:unnamed protein product [Ilex paraguariensis]|uniref:Uncharacterized protein n=1 Tax=Ilex paraguariensis TaxID=185542 RepID=A0ABC8RF64_9AQUA